MPQEGEALNTSFMKIRNTLHFSDEIQEFGSDNYKIKKKLIRALRKSIRGAYFQLVGCVVK